LVAGKLYGLLLLGGVQTTVYLLAGRFLFGVNLGPHLGAVLLTMLVYTWVASSLGVFLGSLVRGEDKVVGLAILLSLTMGALGGCWWPLEIVSPGLKTVAYCLPTGWALEALHQLISFGGGLADAGRPLGVLAAFGVAANILAAWFFRW
jgi:ABC-2 type transport system permease protein